MLDCVMLSLASMLGSRWPMNLSTDSTTKYYAVISVRNNSPRERVIIAYRDEKSLRKLIASPSILALGYGSHAEALAYSEDVSPLACALPPEANATLNATVTQPVTEFRAIRWATKARIDRPITREKIRFLVQYIFAVAIGLIYSRNLVSGMLRAFVSF
jgi:hypothetical protein